MDKMKKPDQEINHGGHAGGSKGIKKPSSTKREINYFVIFMAFLVLILLLILIF